MSRHYKQHAKKAKLSKKRKKRIKLKEIKKKSGLSNKMSMLFMVLFAFAFYIYLCVEKALLREYGIKTKAVVSSDWYSPGRRSSGKYFKFKFKLNGKSYWGRSHIDYSEKDRIGDSIDIVYLDSWPLISRRVEDLN